MEDLEAWSFIVFAIFTIIVGGGFISAIENDCPYKPHRPNAFMEGVKNAVSCLIYVVMIAFLCKILF